MSVFGGMFSSRKSSADSTAETESTNSDASISLPHHDQASSVHDFTLIPSNFSTENLLETSKSNPTKKMAFVDTIPVRRARLVSVDSSIGFPRKLTSELKAQLGGKEVGGYYYDKNNNMRHISSIDKSSLSSNNHEYEGYERSRRTKSHGDMDPDDSGFMRTLTMERTTLDSTPLSSQRSCSEFTKFSVSPFSQSKSKNNDKEKKRSSNKWYHFNWLYDSTATNTTTDSNNINKDTKTKRQRKGASSKSSHGMDRRSKNNKTVDGINIYDDDTNDNHENTPSRSLGGVLKTDSNNSDSSTGKYHIQSNHRDLFLTPEQAGVGRKVTFREESDPQDDDTDELSFLVDSLTSRSSSRAYSTASGSGLLAGGGRQGRRESVSGKLGANEIPPHSSSSSTSFSSKLYRWLTTSSSKKRSTQAGDNVIVVTSSTNTAHYDGHNEYHSNSYSPSNSYNSSTPTSSPRSSLPATPSTIMRSSKYLPPPSIIEEDHYNDPELDESHEPVPYTWNSPSRSSLLLETQREASFFVDVIFGTSSTSPTKGGRYSSKRSPYFSDNSRKSNGDISSNTSPDRMSTTTTNPHVEYIGEKIREESQQAPEIELNVLRGTHPHMSRNNTSNSNWSRQNTTDTRSSNWTRSTNHNSDTSLYAAFFQSDRSSDVTSDWGLSSLVGYPLSTRSSFASTFTHGSYSTDHSDTETVDSQYEDDKDVPLSKVMLLPIKAMLALLVSFFNIANWVHFFKRSLRDVANAGRPFFMSDLDEQFFELVRIQPFALGAYMRGMLVTGFASLFFNIYTLSLWSQLRPIVDGMDGSSNAQISTISGLYESVLSSSVITYISSTASSTALLTALQDIHFYSRVFSSLVDDINLCISQCYSVAFSYSALETVLYSWLLFQISLNLLQLPIRVVLHLWCWESSRSVEVATALTLARNMVTSDYWIINRIFGRIIDVTCLFGLCVGEVYLWCSSSDDALRKIIVSLASTNLLVFMVRIGIATGFAISMHDPQVLIEARKRGLSKWDLQVLPSFVFTDYKDVNNNDCSICLAPFDLGEMVTMLPCDQKHSFHTPCIRQWLSRQNSCPLCQRMVGVGG